jgi:PST family polysaccharide transporter
MSDLHPAARPQADLDFAAERLKGNIKVVSIRGGAKTVIAQGITFVIQMASTVTLARILVPADFGIIAMVIAVTGFAEIFKDLGLSTATVQKSEISHQGTSTLFWINVAVSVLIAVIISALAPLISWFYGDPRLTPITVVISIAFVFGGFTVQHQALLQRGMRFTALAAIQILSLLAGAIAGVLSALLGQGYWSLVVMQVTTPFVNMTGVWLASGFRPGLPARGAGVKGMLAFGANLTGFNVLNYFSRNLDNILIGWRWGARALGFYSKAYALMMLPLSQVNTPVSSVAIPVLSRLQDDPDRYRQYYLKAISLIALVTIPGVAFLIVMSEQVVLIVLGPQWIEASRIFRVLAIAALGQPIANSTGWLFITQGRSADMFKWGIIGSSVTLLSFVVGLPWGAVGVAACYTLFNWVVTPFFYWFVGRKGPVNHRHIWIALLPFLWVALCVMGGLLLLRMYVHFPNLLFELGGAILVTVLIVPSALLLFPGGKWHIRNFLDVTLLVVSGSR